jgi:hypothetical protein
MGEDFRVLDCPFTRALLPLFVPEPSGVSILFFADGHNITSQ